MPNETHAIREFGKQWNYMARYGMKQIPIELPPRFEPMPVEFAAAALGILEVPCSTH